MPEVWGGIECTVNRVNDRYHDQIQRAGHEARVGDIDRFAALGITRLRYPVLWERLAPERDVTPRWAQVDPHMSRMQELGITPIAGLVHHGSGPAYTNLTDPRFADHLAGYARLVAERYPWLRWWTPVNEPVSTARFSGLYGHWYPHARRDDIFVQILLNECRGIVQAMRAIREVIPDAMYMHTDDAGVITSSCALSYQAEFENERQMVAMDLVSGRVDRHHLLWSYFRRHGVTEAELEWFQEFRSPPDIAAGDYYVTSDRFLDQRVERHHPAAAGGNGIHQYADVATSECAGWTANFEGVLRRLWDRYRCPVAIGEVHLNGTREAQLQWARACWDAALRVEADGIPVAGVTFWALLGTFDWNELVRHERGFYEVGVFDLRGPAPRETALAKSIRGLAEHGTLMHPVLPVRISAVPIRTPDATRQSPRQAPLAIVGAGGTLGRALVDCCNARGIKYVALTRDALDVTREQVVQDVIGQVKPWAVINASGYVNVDGAELDPERCHAINVAGAVHLARACERTGARLANFSSDLVFDGEKASPYMESDAPAPLNVYGRSKHEAEGRVREVLPEALIVRTSAFFGLDNHNFVVQTLRRLHAGQRVPASTAIVSPTHVRALANTVLDLMVDSAEGVWHLSSAAQLSWADFARDVALHAQLDQSLVYAAEPLALSWRGIRPDYSALGTERGQTMPDFSESLAACVAEWQSRFRHGSHHSASSM